MHNFEHYIIEDDAMLSRLKSYEAQLDPSFKIVLDVETDGTDITSANLYGIGLCFTDQKAFYIPWRNSVGFRYWSPEQEEDICVWLEGVCKKRGIIGHNLIFDVLILEAATYRKLDDDIYCDTILLRHTLVEEGPFGLKDMAVEILGPWADLAQEELKQEVIAKGGRWVKDQKDMYLASTNTLGKYCCWDVMLTKLIFDKYEPRLIEEGLSDLFYQDEVMPLYKKCTIEMKRKGFPIDVLHFINLQESIEKELEVLEQAMYKEIGPLVELFEQRLLDEHFPPKTTGNFPKAVASYIGAPLPINKKTNKITISASAIQQQSTAAPQYKYFYDWMLGKGVDITSDTFKMLYTKTGDLVKEVQLKMWKEKYETDRVFNLSSNDHLIELFFKIKGLKPLNTTEKGKPQVDDDFLEVAAKRDTFADKLQTYKKLNKLLTTYINGILDRQRAGVIYTDMLQFGTTSGRFSSRNPNLQNLPRPIEAKDAAKMGMEPVVLKYLNAIREGFVAPEGYVLVDADYSALEPRCFAHMSGDEILRDVFRSGEDLYSRIAIDVFNVEGVSARPGDKNYLGDIQKEFRQKTKVFCLAVPYGAEESRIAEEMKVSWGEAKDIIQAYLNAYPNLKKYMAVCNYEAKTKGFVRTEFGRVRHLNEAKAIHTLYGDRVLDYKWAKKNGHEQSRRRLKNALNNSKNFKIQGLAAHIVNRAMIAITDKFKENNIDGYVALQIHDQVVSVVRKDQAEQARLIMKDCMENTTKISIPLIAEPKIAYNLKESH